MFRDLDALTTEDRICETLETLGVSGAQQPVTCRVLRDDLTHASLCYALVEFGSVALATELLVRTGASPLVIAHTPPSGHIEIGGKLVTINYSKFTLATT